MNHTFPRHHLRHALLLGAFLALSAAASSLEASRHVREQPLGETPQVRLPADALAAPAHWHLGFDNDVLVPGRRDQDYTYGLNLRFSGAGADRHWASLHTLLKPLDSALDLGGDYRQQHIEYGLFGFTPEDIETPEANANDRPYASLLYVASGHDYVDARHQRVWSTQLSVGWLGLGVVGELQEGVHELTSGDQPRGWRHQIADGGEATARFSVARQQLLSAVGESHELKLTVQASVGYLTELSLGLGGRAGHINSPWLSFNPELASYGEKATQDGQSPSTERYVWGGIAVKARLYNAFLQGQFRDSAVSYDSEDLHHLLLEAWLGYTVALDSGVQLSYSLRAHTSELRRGDADRAVVWGGIQVARHFGGA